MPKLAIYVSKQDMKSIERWRKRINFSKLFIHAVFDEMRRLERSVTAPEGKVAAAADYYRSKMSQIAGPLTEFGFELGAAHVLDCKLSPEVIRKLLEVRNVGVEAAEDRKLIEQTLGEDLRNVEQFANDHGFREETFPTWRTAAYRGYLDGVAAAWEKVCLKMRESS